MKKLLMMLLLAACAGSGTEPKPTPTGVQKVAKVSGDAQVTKVTLKLGQPLVAFAYLDTMHGARADRIMLASFGDTTSTIFNLGIPLANRTISFVVPDPACGAPFSNAELTDAAGVVKQLWTAGTKASVDCTMEARAVDQVTGLPITYATFHATFKAFPVTQAVIIPPNGTFITGHPGDTVNVQALIVKAFDQYNNENTDYLVRFQRLNMSNPTASDTAPVVGTKAVLRLGDDHLLIYTDSLYTDKLVRVTP